MKKQTQTLAAGIITATLIATTTVFASSKNDDEDQLNASISIEQAIAKAKEAIPGRVIETELESEDNRSIWEIELIGEDKQRYEIEIDANTGDVISQEKEEEEDDDDDGHYRSKYHGDDS